MSQYNHHWPPSPDMLSGSRPPNILPSGSGPIPQISGTKRAAQSSPSRSFQSSGSPRRMPPPPVLRTRYYPANMSGYMRKRTSGSFTQSLAPPPVHQRFASKQPARDATFSSPTSISSARRITASISAPIPVKTSTHNLPYWQINDSASSRVADGSRLVAAMSVGDRSAEPSDYRDITDKKYAYTNDNVREEYSKERYVGRKAARKSEEQEQPRLSDDDSTSASSSSSSNSDDDWESVSESEPERPASPESSSNSSVEILDPRPFRAPVIELLDDTPPPTPRPSAAPDSIMATIESLMLPLACMQDVGRLPFLKRNLRRGFLKFCRAHGVATESDDVSPSLTVIFKLAESELPPHESLVSSCECPLCTLHPPFPTKGMLEIHLDRDHREIRTNWEEVDAKTHWRLELLFTARNEDDAMSLPPTPERLTPSPEPRMTTSESMAADPPNPLGPTARYPFLPAKSEYGGPDIKFSVRFGGPKIYDLLATLPLEPYGILAWAVLDREEEIFESDDLPDEHKVMHALWARWIALNRNIFVAHFSNGTQMFIDEYWKMIRLAAGWDALRYWLLMLMANKFLSGREVATLLKRYERWCSED